MVKGPAKICLILTGFQTLVYSLLYYFNIDWYTGIIEVLTLPMLIVFYLLNSHKKSLLFIAAMLCVFAGDIIDTFYPEIYDWVIFLFALNLAYYSFVALLEIEAISLKQILATGVPYTAMYLFLFIWLRGPMTNLNLGIVLIYNFFLGIFSICSWILFFFKRKYGSLSLIIASASVICISCLYLYVEFIEYSKIIDFFIVNALFLIFHASMTLFVLKKEERERTIV